MPRGEKSAYSDKQKRQARHIEESYKSRGRSSATAERAAWATVNKQDGGGKKKRSSSTRKKRTTSSRSTSRKSASPRSRNRSSAGRSRR